MNLDISKKIIVCDLDGTLARSKSKLEESMAQAISSVLEHHLFAVISGGAFPQFEKQFLSALSISSSKLKNLYLFPANGSTAYVYNENEEGWEQLYDEPLTDEEKSKIMKAFQVALSESGVLLGGSYGEIIEDRGGQITFSALGQQAPIEAKEVWDPDQEKRKKIASLLMREIPEFEIKIGGATSIDITHKHIDKAYAIGKIEKYLDIKKEEILFIGDAIFPGGNDYSAVSMGVPFIQVSGPDKTLEILKRYAQV